MGAALPMAGETASAVARALVGAVAFVGGGVVSLGAGRRSGDGGHRLRWRTRGVAGGDAQGLTRHVSAPRVDLMFKQFSASLLSFFLLKKARTDSTRPVESSSPSSLAGIAGCGCGGCSSGAGALRLLSV